MRSLNNLPPHPIYLSTTSSEHLPHIHLIFTHSLSLALKLAHVRNVLRLPAAQARNILQIDFNPETDSGRAHLHVRRTTPCRHTKHVEQINFMNRRLS